MPLDDPLVFGPQLRLDGVRETVVDRGRFEDRPQLVGRLLRDARDGGERRRPEKPACLRDPETGMGEPGPDLRHILASRLGPRSDRCLVADRRSLGGDLGRKPGERLTKASSTAAATISLE